VRLASFYVIVTMPLEGRAFSERLAFYRVLLASVALSSLSNFPGVIHWVNSSELKLSLSLHPPRFFFLFLF